MDHTEAAQDALEATDAYLESLRAEAISRADVDKGDVSDLDMLDELAECIDKLQLAMQQVDAGTLSIDRLGLALLNVRDAFAHRKAGVADAPDADTAASLAFLGQPVGRITTSLRTVFTPCITADRRMEHMAHVLQERRTTTRRLADRLIARGQDETMAGLQAKLAQRGYPTTSGADHV